MKISPILHPYYSNTTKSNKNTPFKRDVTTKENINGVIQSSLKDSEKKLILDAYDKCKEYIDGLDADINLRYSPNKQKKSWFSNEYVFPNSSSGILTSIVSTLKRYSNIDKQGLSIAYINAVLPFESFWLISTLGISAKELNTSAFESLAARKYGVSLNIFSRFISISSALSSWSTVLLFDALAA